MAFQIPVSLGFILPQRKISLGGKKSASVLELNIWTWLGRLGNKLGHEKTKSFHL